jgi:hypothetical protein
MNAVKVAGGDAVPYSAGRHAGRTQLGGGNNPALARSGPCNHGISAGRGDFFRHIRKKSPSAGVLP